MPVPDETWAQVARDSREALNYLGYPIGPRCLPDEPEACGGSYTQHAVAHLATIKAIADHQLQHAGMPAAAAEIYEHAAAELDQRDGDR